MTKELLAPLGSGGDGRILPPSRWASARR